MKYTGSIEISHSQIAIFESTLKSPFNDWSPQHVVQGFSWRERSVSFKTLLEVGSLDYVIRTQDFYSQPDKETTRSVKVPFKVRSEYPLLIASIIQSSIFSLERGDYSLFFDTKIVNEDEFKMQATFTFCRSKDKSPIILIADPDIEIPKDGIYNMKAEPAFGGTGDR